MESRGIHGEGLEHERDYIEERIDDAGDTGDYAAASEKLKQEERDLAAMAGGQGASKADGDSGALRREADVGGDRLQHRQGAQLEATSRSQVDLDQQPPEAEASAGTVDRIREGLGS